jgi:hypothetical protein
MLTRFFQLAFVAAVTTIPLTGCVVEDRDLDDTPPVMTTPDVDDNEPEIDIQAPGTDVEVDTVE